jgi:hypothetical protein
MQGIPVIQINNRIPQAVYMSGIERDLAPVIE